MIGSSKVFVCTNNSEIKEFGSGSGGNSGSTLATSAKGGAGGSGGGGTGVYNGYTINSSSENTMPDGANNTGGGGIGYKMVQYDSSESYTYRSSGSGGSGIVVIRNIRS